MRSILVPVLAAAIATCAQANTEATARVRSRKTAAASGNAIGRVTSLPGLGTLNFTMYAGYIDVQDVSKHMYFWLQEHADPNAPVLFWNTGGPGCSSMEGSLKELGAIHVTDEGVPYLNPHSWTNAATVVFVDSPNGVGFSYSDDPSRDYHASDISTARDMHTFIRGFFDEFPRLKDRGFYLTGESYAGVYTPNLAALVIDDPDLDPHFRGVAIGNGLLDDDDNAQTHLDYVYSHALVGEQLYSAANTACSGNFSDPVGKCAEALEAAAAEIGPVNPYWIIGPCKGPHADAAARASAARRLSVLNPFAAEAQRLGGGAPCVASGGMSKWLNDPEVQRSLHVKEGLTWELCSNKITYSRDGTTQRPHLSKIEKAGKKILIYNGDSDSVCNWMGNARTVRGVFGAVPESGKRAPWFVDDQVAGYVEHRLNGQVIFATVRGAGHMVPQWAPPQALAMITRFLDGSL